MMNQLAVLAVHSSPGTICLVGLSDFNTKVIEEAERKDVCASLKYPGCFLSAPDSHSPVPSRRGTLWLDWLSKPCRSAPTLSWFHQILCLTLRRTASMPIAPKFPEVSCDHGIGSQPISDRSMTAVMSMKSRIPSNKKRWRSIYSHWVCFSVSSFWTICLHSPGKYPMIREDDTNESRVATWKILVHFNG